jgi:hypothetical protein
MAIYLCWRELTSGDEIIRERYTGRLTLRALRANQDRLVRLNADVTSSWYATDAGPVDVRTVAT